MAAGRKPSLAPAGRAVLVTGASSGLGEACALRLERTGFRVFAGVRKEADGEALAGRSAHGRITAVRVDVTDRASIASAAQEIASLTAGRPLWGLVNNAGICVSAPLECVDPEQLRQQLDTNVVGQLAVAQAFLPDLRRSRGRIVNVTSGLGSVALPYLGAYAAAQFAKEALTDVLRRELRSQRIGVSVVQPGAIMTPIWSKVSAGGEAALAGVEESVAELYRVPFLRFLRQNEAGAAASGTRPGDFAAAVVKALTAARPRARYRVGDDARRAGVLARVLPDPVLDRYLRPLTD
ncbi:SDR family NAD(P)-dependent oxidoreductase [Streptomyces sp. NPDC098077]|uniref:SDR family NAD(P)-dependent oxidoreductase n=1 Tax=Streptomyces sp. NPDC098077 TaxID=3366093 RepID=UPI0038268D9E